MATKPNESEPFATVIRRETHADTTPMMADMFDCTLDDLPDKCGWANEHVELMGHRGTHIDAPWHYFPSTAGTPVRTDASLIWAAHRVGIEREYCQIEKLANLDQLPRSHGFKVACFPVKLDGSAGWTRVVGMLEE